MHAEIGRQRNFRTRERGIKRKSATYCLPPKKMARTQMGPDHVVVKRTKRRPLGDCGCLRTARRLSFRQDHLAGYYRNIPRNTSFLTRTLPRHPNARDERSRGPLVRRGCVTHDLLQYSRRYREKDKLNSPHRNHVRARGPAISRGRSPARTSRRQQQDSADRIVVHRRLQFNRSVEG